MQEALLNSTISLELEEQYRRNIDEEIKLFENDKYALLFYRSIKDKKEEAFNCVRFNVDMENGKKMYQFIFYHSVSRYNTRNTTFYQMTHIL